LFRHRAQESGLVSPPCRRFLVPCWRAAFPDNGSTPKWRQTEMRWSAAQTLAYIITGVPHEWKDWTSKMGPEIEPAAIKLGRAVGADRVSAWAGEPLKGRLSRYPAINFAFRDLSGSCVPTETWRLHLHIDYQPMRVAVGTGLNLIRMRSSKHSQSRLQPVPNTGCWMKLGGFTPRVRSASEMIC
jgi:hypothetical protein